MLDITDHLGLTRTRVTDEKHMQVPPDPRAVGEVFGDAGEQLEDHRELLLLVAVDGGRDGVHHRLVDVLAVREFDDLAFVRLGDVHVLELLVLDGDGDAVHVQVEDGGLLVALLDLLDVEDADAGDVVPRTHLPGDVVDDVDVERLGRLATAEPLWRLLDPELLRVDELRLVEVDAERALSLAALALVRLLEAAVALRDVRHRAAALALEGGLGDLRPDVGRLPDDARDRDEFADVVVVDADAADVDAFGEVLHPDVRATEADVGGEVVEPQRLLGVLAHLVRFIAKVLGEVAVELEQIVVVDVQRPLFVGVSLREGA